jgi:hypothetical protein
MPANPLAGAKYGLVNRTYRPLHDPEARPRLDPAPFLERGLDVAVL